MGTGVSPWNWWDPPAVERVSDVGEHRGRAPWLQARHELHRQVLLRAVERLQGGSGGGLGAGAYTRPLFGSTSALSVRQEVRLGIV